MKIWCGVARRLILGDWWHPVSKAQKTDVRGHTGPEETNLWKNVRAELIPEITAWASVTKAAGKECWRTPQLPGRCKPWVTHHLLLTININKVFKSLHDWTLSLNLMHSIHNSFITVAKTLRVHLLFCRIRTTKIVLATNRPTHYIQRQIGIVIMKMLCYVMNKIKR